MQDKPEVSETNIDNILPFRLRGDEPPKGPWLLDLPNGTRFLAHKNANPEADLMDFVVSSEPLPAVYLGYNLAEQGGGWKFFDPVKFSKTFTLHTIIKEVQDGNSPAVQTGGMASDGQCEVLSPVHED